MKKEAVLAQIRTERIVPVIRTSNLDEARQAIEIIGSCGINVFEITLTIPNAADLIKELSATDFLIGAGTVLDVAQAQYCIESGAKFIVSPIFNKEVVKFCNEKGVAVMPAGLTPTEIFKAWQSGADCVKIFPCDSMGGATYLKALKSVFPQINLMPTGGVSLETIQGLLKAGAFAVGVGSDLVNLNAIREGKVEVIAEKLKLYKEKI